MGQCDAMANTGWPKAFALLQTINRQRRRQAIATADQLSQFLEKALFACQLPDDANGAGRK
jgi:hypothetical protein